MPSATREEFIIRTKLHRPMVSKDHLHRDDLLKRFRNRHRLLTLVSAPAGYGKSTFVSCWLDTCNTPSTWLSLDANDNDTRLFLAYFISAIQKLFPLACGESLSMLKGAHMPPRSLLAGSLINEIEQIQKEFILVLDDYHLIRNKNIHQLVADLLYHPPDGMYLVVIGRRDPPLPLTTLRARGQMVEIRTRDLRFSLSETKDLLERISGVPVDDAIAVILEDKTEGWVTGLCLAALSLQHNKELLYKLTDLPVENRYIMDYVMAEILSHQTPATQEYLLKCSILNRFCASLCEAICCPDKDPAAGDLDQHGNDCAERMNEETMFIISLDDEGVWFRYHHLFQNLLKRQLKKLHNAEEIAKLHKIASAWFAKNDFVDEAIFHALESEDKKASVRLIKQHRHDIINREQWFHLNRWLQKFPLNFLQSDPELMLAKAWLYQRQARYSKLFEILDEIERLPSLLDTASADSRLVRGEIQALRSFQYFSIGQMGLAEITGRAALDFLPPRQSSIRGFSLMVVALAMQMQGNLGQAYHVVHEAMQKEEASVPVYKSMLLAVLCFMSWISADCKKLKLAAAQLLKHGLENSLPETAFISRFFSGILCYQQNHLDLAERFLSPAGTFPVIGELALPSIVIYCQGSFALSSTYLAMGRVEEADQIIESVIGYMLESGNADLLELCQAFQADLALRMGKIAEADLWRRNHPLKPLTPAYRFYTADLTLPRMLLAKRTANNLNEAERILCQLHTYHAATHNTRMVIEILVMQALLQALRGEQVKAFATLLEVLALAEPGRIIRPFLDMGSEMADLLGCLLKHNPTLNFAGQIYEAFGSKNNTIDIKQDDDGSTLRPSPSADFYIPPLTNREIEVLKILASGMSNTEIGDALYISPETVKRHLSTIYQKLEVKNRHQAVMIGKSMGIL
ncbi:LuxR C-terminal-related transcriptional regulator [Desulfocastanea catecholica]